MSGLSGLSGISGTSGTSGADGVPSSALLLAGTPLLLNGLYLLLV